MEETIINFIREIGVDNVIRLVAAAIAGFGARGIYQVIVRSGKDAETIRRALEREQAHADTERQHADELEEDITGQITERHALLERLAKAEAERDSCRELLSSSGLGSLNVSEEQTLRGMITRLKEENRRLNEQLKNQTTGDGNNE